jgi:hypothetical protein
MSQTAPYTGPVFFVVHAPAENTGNTANEEYARRLFKSNRGKIIKSLENAAQRGIPVVYWAAYNNAGEDTIQELYAKARKKPKLIEIKSVKSKFMLGEIKKHGINPTEFVFYGQLRNMCVQSAAIELRRAYPSAKMIIMEGTHTVFLGKKAEREFMRKAYKAHTITLGKKLKIKKRK